MEMYAALYRAVQSRRLRSQPAVQSANGEASQTAALGTDFGAT